MRIAYFSPLPPERSGIADYSRELLPHLVEHVELVLYSAAPQDVEANLRAQFEIHHVDKFPEERWGFDLALYQMGNSAYHAAFYPHLLRYPGLVVLHDFAIHHFIAHQTVDQGDFAGYAREMGYGQGAAGVQRAHAVRLGQAPSAVFDFPLNDRLLDSSLGLVVHSRYVAEKVRQKDFDRPLSIIPALIEVHPGHSRRDELDLAEEAVLFASYGVITGQKKIDMALQAFKRVQTRIPNAHYLLVGEALEEFDLKGLIKELDLAGSVTQIGYVPDLAGFIDWVHTADIVINLREPTMGETSATALRAMAAGKPLIVFDHGWYDEIPDDAALKTKPSDENRLLEAMLRLGKSPELREQMGAAGRRYTQEVCHPQAVAKAYLQAITATVESGMVPHG